MPAGRWPRHSARSGPGGLGRTGDREGRVAAREAYRALLGDVDASVMLTGAMTAHPAYAALQDLLAEGGARRTVHFHWLHGDSAFPLPGQPLPPAHAIEAVYERAVLEADYQSLRASMGETAIVTDGRLVLE